MTDKEKNSIQLCVGSKSQSNRRHVEKPFDKHKNRITNRNRLKGSMQQTDAVLGCIISDICRKYNSQNSKYIQKSRKGSFFVHSSELQQLCAMRGCLVLDKLLKKLVS